MRVKGEFKPNSVNWWTDLSKRSVLQRHKVWSRNTHHRSKDPQTNLWIIWKMELLQWPRCCMSCGGTTTTSISHDSTNKSVVQLFGGFCKLGSPVRISSCFLFRVTKLGTKTECNQNVHESNTSVLCMKGGRCKLSIGLDVKGNIHHISPSYDFRSVGEHVLTGSPPKVAEWGSEKWT